MLQLPEVRIGNFFKYQPFIGEKYKTGKVTQIHQKQVLIDHKWIGLNYLAPIGITPDSLLHSGFKEFNWLKGSSVFQCEHFSCTLDTHGVNLFCDNLKNLKPVKYIHELQNLYFDLTGQELEVDFSYARLTKPEMAR